MADATVTVTDNRTGRRYELPIEHDAIRATDLRRLGLASYDPSLANTATCQSKITYIDGERGILRYRGYPIEQLAEHSTFLETAYLIVKGELPTETHFRMWRHNIAMHSLTHESVKRFIDGFRYNAHPMGILIGTLGALSTFYPDAKDIRALESRRVQTRRLIGKVPTLAAWAYRHSRGLPYVYPDNDLTYPGNFLSMMFKMTELKYAPDPVLERALDVLFICHADLEQNCSATVMRIVGSAHADPYVAVASAAAALSGARHGATTEEVIEMLESIGSVTAARDFVARVKTGGARLAGFGHPTFTRRDPRTAILRRVAHEVFELTPANPLIDIARALEEIVSDDDHFASRGLYPGIDFYAALIYTAMGLPLAMFPVLLAIPRTAGWMAQWAELLLDDEQRITRPRQIYMGYEERAYVPLGQRPEEDALEPEVRGPL
jgi:citrate synthase